MNTDMKLTHAAMGALAEGASEFMPISDVMTPKDQELQIRLIKQYGYSEIISGISYHANIIEGGVLYSVMDILADAADKLSRVSEGAEQVCVD